MKRQFHLDEERITLPKGTRVVLKTDLRARDDGEQAYLCKAGTVGVVAEASYDTYLVRTPAGRTLDCQRDQVVIQRRDQLPALATRQHSFATLCHRVIFSSVVGSTAWGLSGEDSDLDLKGIFVLPMEQSAGLWDPPDEIQDPANDTQYWEVQKAVYQGLRADANTLEMLWSPRVQVCTELGQQLLERRRMFVSRNIFGTFGRYAMSQFRKMRSASQRQRVQQTIVELLASKEGLSEVQLVERLCQGEVVTGGRAPREAKEAIRNLHRSLFDRGVLKRRGFDALVQRLAEHGDAEVAPLLEERPRWKNAYNLLRLLSSGILWLTEGRPLIQVEGPLREELLAVKGGQVPLDRVLQRADELAEELEQAFQRTTLPEEPDYEAAHEFLLRCRRHAAAEDLTNSERGARSAEREDGRAAGSEHGPVEVLAEEDGAAVETAPARLDVPMERLRQFMQRYDHLDMVVCSLVGSHSYGFPSRDSDFDIKAIHLAPAEQLVGLQRPKETEQFLGFDDDLEMDFTSHEANKALVLLLKGDGNVLERILSPYLVAPAELDLRLRQLRRLAVANLSKHFHRHYAGFFRGQQRMYEKAGVRKIKTLLYMFRVALTGVHLMRQGRLLPDLPLLLEIYPFPEVAELLRPKEQAELATVEDDRPYLALMPRLEQLLDEALEASALPDEPPCPQELDRWLRRWRMG